MAAPYGANINRGPYHVLATVIGEVTDTPAGNVALRIGKETEPHGPWEQVEYLILTPREVDGLITDLIGALHEPSILRPLVVIDDTGGVVQGEYSYPGTGKPEVFVLDFEREWSPEVVAALTVDVEAAITAIELRLAHLPVDETTDDRAQIADWRQQLADLAADVAGVALD